MLPEHQNEWEKGIKELLDIEVEVPVRKVPEWKEIDYNIRNGRIMFEVDELKGHCMIEIQYSMKKTKGE